MSNMKNGFSTLNRWLGKKNKDKTAPNGKLSKSTTNLSHPLSISTTNINETSQLEYNRITPLPAATSNAPFEQTFRITVLLPKDQLYVARLGARVPLSKLLELVCENKLLDADKYEFRNPVDPSQVYNTDLTIGAVGLSEVRLCHKSESYDNFNTDEVIKLHRTPVIRDSLSSSEFSSRNSKHTMKTASPYSSSNSLNSMDSTGMNYTRTPVAVPSVLSTATTTSTTSSSKLSAPPRKKRAAPRPPSQIVIPEKSPLVIENIDSEKVIEALKENKMPLRKDYYESTPNLTAPSIDCNGNGNINENANNNNNNNIDCYDEPLYAEVEQKNARNRYSSSSVQDFNGVNANKTEMYKLPEPSPRKRIIQIKKKSAPAPPPRGSSIYSEDSESIASFTISTPGTPLTPTTPDLTTRNSSAFKITNTQIENQVISEVCIPKPAVRETTVITTTTTTSAVNNIENTTKDKPLQASTPTTVPKPVPRVTTTTLLNANNDTITAAETKVSNISTPEPITQRQTQTQTQTTNVSKVLLNRTPTPEPRSLSSEPPDVDEISTLNDKPICDEDDNVSKQADSGIGEPVPSPIPDSLPSEGSAHECKSNFESSSDDDETVKVYNFKLGKTVIKPINGYVATEDVSKVNETVDSSDENNLINTTQETTPVVSETSSWNFSIPISPPPNFADVKSTEHSKTNAQNGNRVKTPDVPITPKIKERPRLNFDTFTANSPKKDDVDHESVKTKTTTTTITTKEIVSSTGSIQSPNSPMNEIVDELSSIINEKRINTLIKKVEDSDEIKAAKPNTLTNFSIGAISQSQQQPQQLQQQSQPQPQPQPQAKPQPEPQTQRPLNQPSQQLPKPLSQQTSVESPKQLPQQSPKQLIQQHSNKSKETSIVTLNSTAASEPILDEEKLYRKNGNITNGNSNTSLQQRCFVTRADSFHATVSSLQSPSKSHSPTEGLNSRSSSHLSLTKLEQNGLNLNRRRSSSELSIGESPSLQSLEVIKTILNSRKNSLATSSDGETKTEVDNIIETKATNVAETQPKSNERAEIPAPPTISTKPKELPKVYRYSGPPSINFSTWSERPKAQVSIKNEGDYIFGGKNASSMNAAVTKAAVQIHNTQQSQENNVDSPIQRMGIPEKEYHVPITVKPLKDVTVENVELRNANRDVKTNSTTTISINGETKSNNRNTESVFIRRPLAQFSNNTSTLPRSNGNRFSTPVMPGPQILRSTSITKTDANKPKVEIAAKATATTTTTTTTTISTPTTQTAAPFGQNTLRKTGLKEKILATEEEKREQAVKMGNKLQAQTEAQQQQKQQQHENTKIIQNGSVTITTNGGGGNTPTAQTTKTLQSSKLELKLQNSANVFVNQQKSTLSKPQTPKSAPAASITPPPPPPAPTSNGKFLKSVSLKSTGSSASTPTDQGDARDQLLEAIRNFKWEGVRRS